MAPQISIKRRAKAAAAMAVMSTPVAVFVGPFIFVMFGIGEVWALGIAFVMFLSAIAAAIFVSPELQVNACRACGYSLEGLGSDRCPECGEVIEGDGASGRGQ